jgi:hypothetical protein
MTDRAVRGENRANLAREGDVGGDRVVRGGACGDDEKDGRERRDRAA